MARIDLLTVGETFQDLIFAGLSRLPRAGENRKACGTRAEGVGVRMTPVYFVGDTNSTSRGPLHGEKRARTTSISGGERHRRSREGRNRVEGR